MSLTVGQVLSLSNLGQPKVRVNPYPFYAQIRSQDPVHWDEELGFWILSRYVDIDSLYTDERFSRAQGLMRGFERLPVSEQKIAGPVYRFERVCNNMIEGNYTDVIKLRKGDEMQNLASLLNEVVKTSRERMQRLCIAVDQEERKNILSSIKI